MKNVNFMKDEVKHSVFNEKHSVSKKDFMGKVFILKKDKRIKEIECCMLSVL